MQNKIHILYLVLCLAMAGSVTSCKKFLDVTPENVGTLDYAFRNRNEAENYLFSCYSTLQSLADITRDPSFTTSGEIIYPNVLGEGPKLYDAGFQLMRGTQNISNPVLNYWDGSNGAPSVFKAIRRCNILLENIDKPIDLSVFEKDRWIAEVKFLKAYYHYFLVKMYGPIPIYRTNHAITDPIGTLRVKRLPVDSAFDYAVQLLDEAIPELPTEIADVNRELGRVTQAVALAVKAEILVTRASPLFNGNPDYRNYKNADGQALFSASADPAKWAAAAAACKAAIDACRQLNLGLYHFIRPANIPATLPQVLSGILTLQNAVTEKWDLNKEIIWNLNSYFPQQANAVPRITAEFDLGSAPGTLAVPISTTDLFYTKNGVPIDEDNSWDFSGRFNLRTGDAANKYLIAQNYQTIKNNFDRELRYYAGIGFDGGIWYGNGVTNPDAALSVQAQKGPAAPKDNSRLNVTSIWPKKLVHYLSVFDKNGFSQTSFRLPRIRLADLYLQYAEALNEVNGPSSEVYAYIDSVRLRAGLKGVQESWQQYSFNPGKPSTKDGLRTIIHRERRIELCFEGKAGWDLKRWKEWTSVMSQPMQGWSIYQSAPSDFYIPVTQFIPTITSKDYFFPLSDQALRENENLIQSPFWK
ncbi:RagB/SusD family nutrient uptake outer membrane protein [Niabella drilacis]|uniref:Starch-binding associating with outer membrane n=1 Tax=Niabella drilacis (strain DSM 25811 / CCM 8410 / CCUG 62505 / LMG 26954 / E90) TaxID=1285928 RepID=A0A1G6RIK8_NIADE|nr:RagB/SusD family nutrient uptake outer membrane protein [Niabella drilacis]SDD04462.1 Starch-binding associating with outer membrane [Niabella drilacis]